MKAKKEVWGLTREVRERDSEDATATSGSEVEASLTGQIRPLLGITMACMRDSELGVAAGSGTVICRALIASGVVLAACDPRKGLGVHKFNGGIVDDAAHVIYVL